MKKHGYYLRRKLGLVLLAAGGAAAAARGYVVDTSLTIPIGDGSTGAIYFNPQTGQAETGNFSGAEFEIAQNGTTGETDITALVSAGVEVVVAAGINEEANLSAGEAIDGSDGFAGNGTILGGGGGDEFADGTTGYVGYQANNVYGWGTIDVLGDGNVTLTEMAVETTPGEAIAAGEVPEPAETGLAAALAAGVFAGWRRKRRAAFLRQSYRG